MVDDSSTAPLHITSEIAPDLGLVERFIREKFTEGALALLLATVMALLTRMRDLNTELMRQVALGRRKRPPSETMHRLQLELPLWGAVAANDAPPKRKTPKKRGPRNPHPHGRAKLPEHLERKAHNHFVEPNKCTCPHCNADTAHVKFVPSERLDIEPARFIVRLDRMEMRACQQCHDYVVTAPRPDAIVERGVLAVASDRTGPTQGPDSPVRVFAAMAAAHVARLRPRALRRRAQGLCRRAVPQLQAASQA